MKAALAFELLDRTHDDFASAPVVEAFNWAEFARNTKLDHWYLVVFRSVRTPDADVNVLDELDEIAHRDAAMQPGFLFYFKGKILPGATHLKNMSFCMWESREDARAASQRSPHRNASAVALQMYSDYRLERYEATVLRANNQAWIEFVPVTD